MFNPKPLVAAFLMTSVSIAAPLAPRRVVVRGTLDVVQEDDFARNRTGRDPATSSPDSISPDLESIQ